MSSTQPPVTSRTCEAPTSSPASTPDARVFQIGLPVVEHTPEGRLRIFVHREDFALVLVALGGFLQTLAAPHAAAETSDRLKGIGTRLMQALDAEDQAEIRACWKALRRRGTDAA